MDLTREFVEKLEEMARPLIEKTDEGTYAITASGTVEELLPRIDAPETLELHSLDSLVKMVKTEAAPRSCPVYITIPTHLTALCFAQPDPEKRYMRQVYYKAVATDVPGWEPESHMGFEEAQIALRTRFQLAQDNEYVMKLLSDITCGAKVVYNDNGIATTVTTQKGVALQTNTQIRPIVSLKPYRTFQEVEQPESCFLIRVGDRGIRFVEADGGMWKLHARETIKKFLEDKLKAEIELGTVIVSL